MDEMTKIAVDAMGGDNAPLEIVLPMTRVEKISSSFNRYCIALAYP